MSENLTKRENATNHRPRSGRPTRTPSERGDEAALFLDHQRFLLRVTTRKLGGSQDLAEDACAFAWLQLLRYQPDRERVVGWLRVVARNEGHRLLRIGRREPFLGVAAPQRVRRFPFRRQPGLIDVDRRRAADVVEQVLMGLIQRRGGAPQDGVDRPA